MKFLRESILTTNTPITETQESQTMERKGLSQRAVLKELESRLEKDFSYKSGRIVGSMCTKANRFAGKTYACFLDKNLGDLGLFPGVAELEKETVRMLGSMLSNPEASGHIVTGGTEANILALWAARKIAKKDHGEVIVPASAHCSFDKAGDLLGLKIVRAGLDDSYRVDVDSVRNAINPNTIAIVGVAGTTGLGAVDPIAELSEVALEKGLYFHVDAAFGGFVLPFLKELEPNLPTFDFAATGVCSITVDPHKMGMAPIPAGGMLFRNERLREAIAWNISYLAGGEAKNATIVGTRSGASVVAVWASLKHLGLDGYKSIVKSCMRLTRRLADEIPKTSCLSLMTRPTMNVIGITSQTLDVKLIAQELRHKGWAVALFPKHIRIVIMPHVRRQHVDAFLEDLKSVADRLSN
jgi:tyrosine decarboxylase/aspartate 1-decarboxylase